MYAILRRNIEVADRSERVAAHLSKAGVDGKESATVLARPRCDEVGVGIRI